MTKIKLDRLKNFPISFLSVVLGLIGFTLILQKIGMTFKVFPSLYFYLLGFTVLLFIMILGFYLAKIVKYPKDVKEEFMHPIKVNFFPILAKIFLISSVIYLQIDMSYSKSLWIIGASLQFIFSIVILSIWLKHPKVKYHHLNPSWFIPIVGNVIVPIAGMAHGFVELSWFFFGIGLVMWLTLFVIVFNRLIFHEPIADKLVPTFFILFAPPAIAFIAYVKMVGSIDSFAKVLYYISLFLLFLIFAQFKSFFRIKFFLSWWAYSFPLDAMILATILAYQETGFLFFKVLLFTLLAILSLIIAYLLSRTTLAVSRGEICIEEED